MHFIIGGDRYGLSARMSQGTEVCLDYNSVTCDVLQNRPKPLKKSPCHMSQGTVCVNPDEKVPVLMAHNGNTRKNSALLFGFHHFIPLLLRCNLDRNTAPFPKDCRSFSAVFEKPQ